MQKISVAVPLILGLWLSEAVCCAVTARAPQWIIGQFFGCFHSVLFDTFSAFFCASLFMATLMLSFDAMMAALRINKWLWT